MELQETILLMQSADYKDRFKAEYFQLKIRLDKLKAMLVNWDNGELQFTPTCPRSTYDLQVKFMQDYLSILDMRAALENIDLSVN